MPQDPYGYQPATTGASTSPSTAMWAGLMAAMLALVGPCTCHTSSLAAIPIGAYALWTGVQARDAAGTTGEQREMALAGMLSGLLSSLWSVMWVALIALYIALYFFIFVAMFAAGAAGGGNEF